MPTAALTTSLLVSMLVLGAARAQTWTEWSAWSECSRTCDGGASYQLRKCPGTQRCEGESIQYKTCNRNPCPAGSGDFRAQQCAAYNDVIYESRLYEWVPISEPRDPCSLRCRAAGHAFSVMLAPKVLDGTRCDDSSVDICINGRCRKVGCDGELGSPTTYDRCGICGGDGSSCRRRGSHPYPQLFRWVETEAGPCSVTCGVGVAKTSVVCKDQRNNQVVYNTYCSHLPRPRPAQRECRAPGCQPVWITGEWQSCTKPCGAGTSRRHAYCVEELQDGSFRNTYDNLCRAPRPTVERPCNQHACPKWYAGSWSPCSVTCAKGYQHREVICRRNQQHGCRLADRPATRRPCETYVTCMGQKAEAQRNRSASLQDGIERESAWKSKSGGDAREDDTANSVFLSSKSDSEINDLLNQMIQGNLSSLPMDETTLSPVGTVVPPSGDDRTSSVAPPGSVTSNQNASETRRVKVKILKEKPDKTKSSKFVPAGEAGQEVYFMHASGRRTSFLEPFLEGRLGEVVGGSESSGEQADDDVLSPDGDQEPAGPPGEAVRNALSAGVSTVPRFIASEWGACSATCGFGIRTRIVICKVYLKFSQTVQDLPDGDCAGEKPEEVEQCIRHECPENQAPEGSTRNSYRWRHDGYSSCNATCLGGVKAPTYKCIELMTAAQVDESLCVGIAKPLVNKVPCNEVPCPPRWRMDQFRPCSALCGGGHRRRRVQCIQELARGAENVAVLPDRDCPPPIPPRSILCNLIDCPPSWVVAGEWSQCSMTCGEGLSTRLVLCQQVVAPGRVQNVSDASICPSVRPDARRPCYNDACPETPTEGGGHVHIATDRTTYVMLQRQRRVQLVVGGQAVLLDGANIVIRCPARHYNRKLVYWRKNDALLPRRGRIKVSRHGALHIKRSSARDAGTYTCVVDANSANISISFQSQRDAEQLLQERLDFLAYSYKDGLGRGRADENRVSPVYHPDRQEVGGPAPARLDRHHLLANSPPYLYVSGPWSSCSQSCGFRGLQWRNVTCELLNESYIRVVDDLHCRRLGLVKPLASQDCGMFKCPHWEIGPWSRCSGHKCSRKGVGTSTRSLYCVLDNGTTTEHGACDGTIKPPGARECRHDVCAAQWRPSEWSKCSRSCGGLGMKRRTLRCVWMNNDAPAGRHCKGMAKPPTDKACNSPDCRHVACVDKSNTCSMIPRLKLCHVWYRECCWSCHVRVGRIPARYQPGGSR